MTKAGTAMAALKTISQRLAERIGPRTYDMWFGNTTKLHLEGSCVRVATDSRFVADWINGHFREALDGVVRDALGGDAEVDLRVAPDLFGRGEGAPAAGNGTAIKARPRPRRRVDRFGGMRSLDEVVVGPGNRLAWSAAERIAEGVADSGSPLFIHGECGVGKTHLLQGIVARVRDRLGGRGGVPARYVTAEQFTNEYINAVRSNSLDEFRKRMRKPELLAIDEVHFLANKTATQREVQHTIDAIDLAGGSIVLAAVDHPLRLGLKPSLASRFVAGMVAAVERPDRATRVKLAMHLAETRGLRLAASAAEAIADRCVGSVRELEGAINKLAALQLVTDAGTGEVGLLLVEQVFADGSWRPRAPLHVDAVIDTVCERLIVSRAELMGSGRHRRVVAARGLVAFLARSLTSLSYPEIAQALGRKHHSTVHTAVSRVGRQLTAGERFEVGEQGETVMVSDLVDQLRHEIMRKARRT